MYEEIKGRLVAIDNKLDMLNEVTIKNGGGRHVTYKRSEFFQMLYDRHSLAKLSKGFYDYAVIILVALQIVEVIVFLTKK